MEIYLAGENGKTRIILSQLDGGGADYEHLSCRRHKWQPVERLEEDSGRKDGRKEGRNVYLAGNHPAKNGPDNHSAGHRILESFYSCRKNPYIAQIIPQLAGFMLDSGAFSFMCGAEKEDWDRYVEEYAEYILANDIKLFFELDIDSVVGLKEVERLRAKLERLTNRQPIPVWHKSRGKDYFEACCKDYPYVAIGGIVTKEVPRNIYEKAFPWFITTAHEHGAKIHGLGYTNIAGLHKYHFDSVDSTAWLYGNRGGYLYHFDAKRGTMAKTDAPEGLRLKSHDAALYNYLEWQKFQAYAEKYL